MQRGRREDGQGGMEFSAPGRSCGRAPGHHACYMMLGGWTKVERARRGGAWRSLSSKAAVPCLQLLTQLCVSLMQDSLGSE